MVKINDTGLIQWQKCLGGTNQEWGYSISQTSDSGYIAAGFTESIDGDITAHYGAQDYWVVKLSQQGRVSVAKIFREVDDVDWALILLLLPPMAVM